MAGNGVAASARRRTADPGRGCARAREFAGAPSGGKPLNVRADCLELADRVLVASFQVPGAGSTPTAATPATCGPSPPARTSPRSRSPCRCAASRGLQTRRHRARPVHRPGHHRPGRPPARPRFHRHRTIPRLRRPGRRTAPRGYPAGRSRRPAMTGPAPQILTFCDRLTVGLISRLTRVSAREGTNTAVRQTLRQAHSVANALLSQGEVQAD